MDSEATCYGGGSITAAILGTAIGTVIAGLVIWWIYKKYLANKKGGQLVIEDPENAKNDFAFDNPAFKNEGVNKSNTSPLDTKWLPKQNGNGNISDKRKTVDDSYAGGPAPRMVSLRGSDFTGLGIEIFGGLKEGIFVKKVSSRGPASGIVNIGDRITSITIDFRHIVQDDATSILSYASPYNVQLELIDGKGVLPQSSNSPKDSPLSHPLYRSSSQDNLDTIERNSRKKLFPNDDSNYPTLKMETKHTDSKDKLPSVHRENEKVKEKKNSFKQQIKDLVEEKLQQRSVTPENNNKTKADVEKSPEDQKKSGLKFGIRVLPPNVNEKLFGKSPTKIDNENNQNQEKNDVEINENKDHMIPPTAARRSKDKNPDIVKSTGHHENVEFRRDLDLNSSGIKRDADGIPQEVPNHMMNAAMAAKDNRKSAALDSKKSKGKAPKPPPNSDEFDFDASTVTVDTNLSLDETDSSNLNKIDNKLNFSDNFVDEIFQKNGLNSTPKINNSNELNNYESDHENDDDKKITNTHIELNSKDITVHHTSEEESGDEGRKTASLGDLSKYNGKLKATSEISSNNGTLERAQSLEMSDSVIQDSNENTRNQRKPTISDTDLTLDRSKEHRLMNIDLDSGLDTLQRGRLKHAYEFGNLEDVISKEHDTSSERSKSPEEMKEVIEAAEKFHKELQDDIVSALEKNEILKMDESFKIIDEMHKIAKVNSENEIIIVDTKEIHENGFIEKEDDINEKNEINNDVMITHTKITNDKDEDDHEKVIKEITKTTTTIITQNSSDDLGNISSMDVNNEEHISISPVKFSLKPMENLEVKHDVSDPNITDHIKIINFGTNIPDDVKVSQYPFVEHDNNKKDDIIKQDHSIMTTTIVQDNENIYLESQPISLTLIGNNDLNKNDEINLNDEVSPVYSSDIQGVNSISISSMEVNIGPDNNKRNDKELVIPGKLGTENIVTISTDSSQPSSIIMIDDEKLDFTLQSPDGSVDGFEIINTITNKINPEESNKQMKNDSKTFITEITVKSPNEEIEELNEKTESNVKIISTTPPNSQNSIQKTTVNNTNYLTNFMANEKHHVEQNYIPRNSEIRFTTSTYESPTKIEKRSTQIDQIRSNFEKNQNENSITGHSNNHHSNINNNTNHHTSSGATVVRKSSIPTLKSSPSKIPVLHSSPSKSNSENNTNLVHHTKQSHGSNNNINRVSVSVTSIKNSSRHPSGK